MLNAEKIKHYFVHLQLTIGEINKSLYSLVDATGEDTAWRTAIMYQAHADLDWEEDGAYDLEGELYYEPVSCREIDADTYLAMSQYLPTNKQRIKTEKTQHKEKIDINVISGIDDHYYLMEQDVAFEGAEVHHMTVPNKPDTTLILYHFDGEEPEVFVMQAKETEGVLDTLLNKLAEEEMPKMLHIDQIYSINDSRLIIEPLVTDSPYSPDDLDARMEINNTPKPF